MRALNPWLDEAARSLTLVIGVLCMENMNPGPTLFTQNPQNIHAVYLLFIVAT